MAYVFPDKARPDLSDDSPEEAYEISELIGAGSTGRWVIVPDNVANVSAELEIGVGQGYIETTRASISRIHSSDINIVPVRWTSGVVTASATEDFQPCTAVRAVNQAGSVRLNIRMQ